MENKVCFYNFNTFYCHITGNIVWVHRNKKGSMWFRIFEIQIFTGVERKPEIDITSESALTVSTFKNDYPPSHIRDSNLATYCNSVTPTSWIQFKFSQIYMISHAETKTYVYGENFYWLKIGMDVDNPTKLAFCASVLKSDEFLKYWCYKRGNAVAVTRNKKTFEFMRSKSTTFKLF